MFIHYETRLHRLRSSAQKSLDRGSEGDSVIVQLDSRAVTSSAVKTKTRRQAMAGDIPPVSVLTGQEQLTMN